MVLTTATYLAIWSAVALFRVLVGFQPHSGQDNHHGSKVAYGGDFEAQRHWMELTWHLPIGQWYWYDLQYWGLDYPPLTAYVSWVCGFFSNMLLGPESIAFESSRGIEDPTHKAFMRGTVLVLDLLVYGSAAWMLARRQSGGGKYDCGYPALWRFVVAMFQPAIILIDHGHFQYNTVALGLSLWCIYYISMPGMRNCVLGSVFFCLALSFKQMTLYYAPIIGCYLLGRCFEKNRFILSRFTTLGATVIATFTVLWWPFVAYGPQGTSPVERLLHVIHRIFPTQRGLFEGKVSNLWCALSVKPFSIRERIPEEFQLATALMLTTLLIVPASIKGFLVGQQYVTRGSIERDTTEYLLAGATSSALAFFLASFQVHEKSLLIALAPATFLLDSEFSGWFSTIATWTLWPLLVVDRLQMGYACAMLIFFSLLQLRNDQGDTAEVPRRSSSFFRRIGMFSWLPVLSHVTMATLHVSEALMTPPAALPDLFPVLWSVVGCGLCCLAYFGSTWNLLMDHEKVKRKQY